MSKNIHSNVKMSIEIDTDTLWDNNEQHGNFFADVCGHFFIKRLSFLKKCCHSVELRGDV